MNRRSFMQTLAKAAAGFTILPAAVTYARHWKFSAKFLVVENFNGLFTGMNANQNAYYLPGLILAQCEFVDKVTGLPVNKVQQVLFDPASDREITLKTIRLKVNDAKIIGKMVYCGETTAAKITHYRLDLGQVQITDEQQAWLAAHPHYQAGEPPVLAPLGSTPIPHKWEQEMLGVWTKG